MSKLAKKLIAENKRTKAKFLDLGKCGLKEIPAEIAEMIWLEGLSLAPRTRNHKGSAWQVDESPNDGAENTFDNLGPLEPMSGLRNLWLGENEGC